MDFMVVGGIITFIIIICVIVVVLIVTRNQGNGINQAQNNIQINNQIINEVLSLINMISNMFSSGKPWTGGGWSIFIIPVDVYGDYYNQKSDRVLVSLNLYDAMIVEKVLNEKIGNRFTVSGSDDGSGYGEYACTAISYARFSGNYKAFMAYLYNVIMSQSQNSLLKFKFDGSRIMTDIIS